MHYFTALGIAVTIIGGLFLSFVLAVPIEVIGMYFTPAVQVISGIMFATVYIVSLLWVKRKIRVIYS